jgi:peroxiredoxin
MQVASEDTIMPALLHPSAWPGGLALVLVFAGACCCQAREPDVSFQVKDGWVEFAVQQDGQPCSDVSIHVIDERGMSFARGETGGEGQGVFPLPPGPSFIIELKTGARTADLVCLRKIGDRLEPARLLLSYGLLPCCKSPVRETATKTSVEDASSPQQSSDWLLFAAAILGLLCGMGLGVRSLQAWRVREVPSGPGENRGQTETPGASAPLRPTTWALGFGILIAGCLGAVWLMRPSAGTAPPARDLAQEARDDLKRRKFKPLSASLDALLADTKYDPVPTQTHPYLRQPAPAFTLSDVDGKEWSLDEALREGPVVLVFYYGYHCDHCVSQLFALQKDIEKFRELGVKVLAISADPPELTRERFKKYGGFAFPVLADPGSKVAAQYGTYLASSKPGEEGNLMHGTFIISSRAGVVWVNRGDSPFTENRTLLHEIARVEGRLPLKAGAE